MRKLPPFVTLAALWVLVAPASAQDQPPYPPCPPVCAHDIGAVAFAGAAAGTNELHAGIEFSLSTHKFGADVGLDNDWYTTSYGYKLTPDLTLYLSRTFAKPSSDSTMVRMDGDAIDDDPETRGFGIGLGYRFLRARVMDYTDAGPDDVRGIVFHVGVALNARDLFSSPPSS